jgi:hypothetical protein
MLNISYIEKRNRQKSYNFDSFEQLFDELSRRARRRQNAPEALQELSDAFVHE